MLYLRRKRSGGGFDSRPLVFVRRKIKSAVQGRFAKKFLLASNPRRVGQRFQGAGTPFWSWSFRGSRNAPLTGGLNRPEACWRMEENKLKVIMQGAAKMRHINEVKVTVGSGRSARSFSLTSRQAREVEAFISARLK